MREEIADAEVSFGDAKRCKLKVHIQAEHASFQYSVDSEGWQPFGPKLDISDLSESLNR
ncbi:hypothetical protein GCM10008013_41190 [Paenibacillus segetis]|uniref:Beta-xylosidase C-terminal Concanavalin A-like domain-containing protein n=1 Tax=Paenibacillus segetis TaxID=1325360 RepID=A0ABQ1YSQ4_9BACL|nr:hypothetical protein GCM10008013_41190 [Paenibacillus segetis]